MAKAMTEREWLDGDNPAGMVSWLRQTKASGRKLRLFGCACCRRVWDKLPGPAAWRAVEAAERHADGMVKRAALAQAALDCETEAPKAVHNAAVMVARLSVKDASFWASYSARVLAAGSGPLDPSQLAAHGEAMDREGREQAKLLHDLFGNPFRPTAIAPAWRTPTVVALAEAAYADLVAARLGVLSDALEEGGCDAADVLAHLRGGGPHARGCWVVDGLLGKR